MERRFLIPRSAVFLFLLGAVGLAVLLAFLAADGWRTAWLPALLLAPWCALYAWLFLRAVRLRVRIDASGVRAGRNVLPWEEIGHACVVHLEDRPQDILLARAFEDISKPPFPGATAERIVLTHSAHTEALVRALYPGEVLRVDLPPAQKHPRARMTARWWRFLLFLVGAAMLLLSLWFLGFNGADVPERRLARREIAFARRVYPLARQFKFDAEDGSGYYISNIVGDAFDESGFLLDVSPGDPLRLIVDEGRPDAAGRFSVYAVESDTVRYLAVDEAQRRFAENDASLLRWTHIGIRLGSALLALASAWWLLSRPRRTHAAPQT